MGWMQGFGWVTSVLVLLAAIFVCGYLLHRLIRWLLSRTGGHETKPLRVDLIYRLLSNLAALCLSIWNGLRSKFNKPDSAGRVYTELLRWGRRSGVRASITETPIEYGMRLGGRIPHFRDEIDVIVEAYCMEIYGDIDISQKHMSSILSAQRKMRNPRYWLTRLKGWFIQPPRWS